MITGVKTYTLSRADGIFIPILLLLYFILSSEKKVLLPLRRN